MNFDDFEIYSIDWMNLLAISSLETLVDKVTLKQVTELV